MSDSEDDALIEQIASVDTLAKIIQELGSQDVSLYVPALRCIGNILTTNDSRIVERCLFNGVLDKLTNLLYQNNSNIIKECLWGFSNISAGSSAHIESLVDCEAFVRIKYLAQSTNIDLRKESLWVICNSITGADFPLRKKILEKLAPELIPLLIAGLSF